MIFILRVITINSHTPITRSAMESEQSLIQSESDIIKKINDT